MARVLIAGCGYVGIQLGLELAEKGHHVWGLRRRIEALPPSIQPLAADLSEPSSLEDLPPGLDYVVYATAADGSAESAYRAAYLEGPGHLLDTLVRLEERPRRVFFLSSTAVYGQKNGEWVDEESPTEPTSTNGGILLAGERRVLSGPYPATILRLGGIYGPGRRRLIRLVEAGEATIDPEVSLFTNRIHRNDAAGMLAHLIALDEQASQGRGAPPTQMYVGVDREAAERQVVLDWLAEQLGVAKPRRAQGTQASPRRRGGNKRCRSDRILASGYRFRYETFRDGYGEMLTQGR